MCDDETLTYEELNARANRLAHALIARRAGPEQIVAITIDRSLALVVALLGTLKAGAAYLTIDLAWPELRRRAVLEDAIPVTHRP